MVVFAVVGNEMKYRIEVLDVMQPITTEFVDAFVDDLLTSLPPRRDTQHYIDHDHGLVCSIDEPIECVPRSMKNSIRC